MLRLAVKAGSIDEADDQRGLAHVLEHMAFNGTAHFKPGELVKYLESIGAQFGPARRTRTRASTRRSTCSTCRPIARGVLARGFEALSDFAGGMSLDTAEIDRERGVVIEEWRGRLGAGTRDAGAAAQGALRGFALHRPHPDRHSGDSEGLPAAAVADAAHAWAPVIIVLSLIGIIYGAIVALVQPDLKKLVAYSSVSHMGFVTLGIFVFQEQGMQGAILQMVNHGLITGALFLLVGVIYERTHDRTIAKMGGLRVDHPGLRRRVRVLRVRVASACPGCPGSSASS